MVKSKYFKHLLVVVVLGTCVFFSQKFYRTQHQQPDLTVVGFINLADGLGRQSAELIDVFKHELKVTFNSTRQGKKKDIPKDFQQFYMDKSTPWGKVVIFEDVLWTPTDSVYLKIAKCDPDSIKFAYSMWESTKIPYEWAMILNEYFDAVLVPSSFLIEVYKNSGVTIPVFELPLGLDMKSLFKLPLKEKCGYPMVFGNLSACSNRKNQLALIQAFALAFGNDPDVLLRINCRYGEKEVKSEVTEEIALLNYDNIIFTQIPLGKDQYLKTLREIDCYVSPSKGEGFSIQPREAMAFGIPVIATNNTGQQEICNSGLVKVVDSMIEEPAMYPWGLYYGRNFNCEIEDLANAMLEVKEHYDRYLTNGKRAREWAKQYQYRNLMALYRSVISPKSIVLGDKNEITEDCIYTDSNALYEKYQQAFGSKITTTYIAEKEVSRNASSNSAL